MHVWYNYKGEEGAAIRDNRLKLAEKVKFLSLFSIAHPVSIKLKPNKMLSVPEVIALF